MKSGQFSIKRSLFQFYQLTYTTNVLLIRINRILKMQVDTPPIFRSILQSDLNSIGHPSVIGAFKANFGYSEHFWTIGATDRYLLYFQTPKSMTPSFVCPFGFDIKFEVIRETPWPNQNTPGRPIGIKFEKQTTLQQFESLELYSQDLEILERWRIFLEGKINQRSFHSLFRAKKKIGRGAFATVYLAERLIDNKMVAVKAFSKQRQYSGQQGKQSLINEIKLLRMFNDPHILKLEGVYETQNSIYVIMEILEGRQLQQKIKKKQITDPKEIQQIIKNILLALRSLAFKNVIHRDLKPENIMFRNENSSDVVICDFGLATAAQEQKYLFVRCGTPGFVAPEIINIRDMSTKSQPISDVFSAGLIFHLLLFGNSIFEGKRYQEILAENRACKFNFHKPQYKKIHLAALDLLKRMLDTNPRHRISAQNALDHPFFSISPNSIFIHQPSAMQIEQPFQPRMEIIENISAMIDQKDEISSKYEKATNAPLKERKDKNSSNAFSSSNYGNTENKMKTPSIHHTKKITKITSTFDDKQNDQEYLPFSKKISFGIDNTELGLRRSKRSSIKQRNNSKYNNRF